jgi:glycine betaine/proline transport system ATP-binding protein
MSSPAIECKSVWKIFGHRPREALELTQTKGIDKDELFRRTGCVIGVADVSFQVGRGGSSASWASPAAASPRWSGTSTG